MKNTIFLPDVFSIVLLAAVAVIAAGCASTAPAPVLDRTAPGATVPPPATEAQPGAYVVKKGDTLYSIARSHGQDPRDVAAWNNITDPSKLEVGQQLRVAPPEGSQIATTSPIAGPSVVETRPLGGPPTPGAPIASGTSTDMFKREPKGGKLPYSEQAWAQLQKADERERKPRELAAVAPSTAGVPSSPPEAKAEPKPGESVAGEDGVEWSWPTNGKLIGSFSDANSKGVDIGGKLGDPVLAAAGGKVVYAGSGLRGYGRLVIIKHSNSLLSAYAHNNQILVKEGQSVTKGQKIAELGNSDSENGQSKLHFEIRRQGKPVDPLKYLPTR